MRTEQPLFMTQTERAPSNTTITTLFQKNLARRYRCVCLRTVAIQVTCVRLRGNSSWPPCALVSHTANQVPKIPKVVHTAANVTCRCIRCAVLPVFPARTCCRTRVHGERMIKPVRYFSPHEGSFPCPPMATGEHPLLGAAYMYLYIYAHTPPLIEVLVTLLFHTACTPYHSEEKGCREITFQFDRTHAQSFGGKTVSGRHVESIHVRLSVNDRMFHYLMLLRRRFCEDTNFPGRLLVSRCPLPPMFSPPPVLLCSSALSLEADVCCLVALVTSVLSLR